MLVAVEAGVGLAGILNSPGTSPTPGPRGGGEDGGWSLCGGLYCTTLTLHWLQPQIPEYEGDGGGGEVLAGILRLLTYTENTTIRILFKDFILC